MPQTINDRIDLLIKEKGFNKNSFSKKVGLSSNAVLENILGKRKSKPSYDVIQKIVLAFKDVNASWLLTGEGEMLTSETSKIERAPPGKCLECDKLRQQLKEKDILISQLTNDKIKLLEETNWLKDELLKADATKQDKTQEKKRTA